MAANLTLALLTAMSAVRTDISGLKAEMRGAVRNILDQERGIIQQELEELRILREQTRAGVEILSEMKLKLREESAWIAEQRAAMAVEMGRLKLMTGVDTWSAVRSPQAAIFVLTWTWRAGGWLRGAGIVFGMVCDWSTTIFVGIGYICYCIWVWASSSWLGRRLLGSASGVGTASASASASGYDSIEHQHQHRGDTGTVASGGSGWWSWVTGWWTTEEVTAAGVEEAVTTAVVGGVVDNGEERTPLLPA